MKLLFVKKRVSDLFAVKGNEWKSTYSKTEQAIKLCSTVVPEKYSRLQHFSLNPKIQNSKT